VLVQALGEDKAGNLIDRILLGRNTTGLDALKWMDPRAIADLVRNEHPQIIAIVLSHLDPDQAAETLKLLPERARTDVLLRIATLDGIRPTRSTSSTRSWSASSPATRTSSRPTSAASRWRPTSSTSWIPGRTRSSSATSARSTPN
jgi:hypothetical protein